MDRVQHALFELRIRDIWLVDLSRALGCHRLALKFKTEALIRHDRILRGEEV